MLALGVLGLSFFDAVLTTRLGFELNPLLRGVFEHHPGWVFLVKALSAPLFIFVARHASWSRTARYGLCVAFGWYACIVVVEAVSLAFA